MKHTNLLLKYYVITIVLVFLVMTHSATAGVPKMINYQGRLTDNEGKPFDTTVSMTFTIYDDSTAGAESKWSEVHPSITVTNGLFNILLGSIDSIPDTVFNNPVRYLGIQVGSETELPRIKFITVPYSFRVSTIDGAKGGTINGDVNIDGDVILTGDTIYVGDIFIEPTTRYLSISASAFNGSQGDSEGGSFYYYSPDPEDEDINNDPERRSEFCIFKAVAHAQVHLPQDAIVTKVTFFFYNSNCPYANFYLLRNSNNNRTSSLESIGYVNDGLSNNNFDSLSITSFSQPTIDNEKYHYEVRVGNKYQFWFFIQGVRIEYTVESPLP